LSCPIKEIETQLFTVMNQEMTFFVPGYALMIAMVRLDGISAGKIGATRGTATYNIDFLTDIHHKGID